MSMELNPNGTKKKREVVKREMVTSTSTWYACPHDKGYYFNVKFLFWTLRLYWCDLCHQPFQAKFIRALLKGKK